MRFDNDTATKIFTESPIGKIILDENLALVEVNKTMLDYFKIKDKKATGEQFGDYFNCTTVSKSGKLCGKSFDCEKCVFRNKLLGFVDHSSTSENFNFNKIFNVNNQPAEKWFDVYVNSIDYEGKKYYLLSFFDKTEYEKIIRDLNKTTVEYNQLFENMTQAFALNEIIIDSEGKPIDFRYLKINNVFETLTGLRKENIIGKTVREVLPNIEHFWIDTFGRVALTGEPCNYDNYVIEFKRYFETRVYCPEIGKFAVVFSDITERKISEQLIIESKEKLECYFDNSPYGVFVADRMGNYVGVNSKACQLTGYTKEELLSKNVLNLVQKEHMKLAETDFKALISSGRLSVELSLLKKTSEIITVTLNAVKLNENEFLGFIEDITEKKAMEDKLKYTYYHDNLTNFYNRRYLFDNLAEIDLEKNYPLSVVMGDINGLRSINEALGYNIGDEIIKKVAEVIKDECESNYVPIRFGGDDYVILMPNKTQNDAKLLVDRISQSLMEKSKDVEALISVAFGTATKVDNSESLKATIRLAEDNLIHNKIYSEKSVQNSPIHIILQTLHEKNKREERHSQRVSKTCSEIGKAMQFSDDAINMLRVMGLVHDIGKIGIDEHILNKAGRLNIDECSQVKQHTEIGYRILAANHQTSELAFYILSHHERLDGTGYPNGIKGENISVFTRILSIADAYDAMTSKRTYSDGLTEFDAVKELLRCSGTQFDEKIVKVFIEKVLPNLAYNLT